MLKSSAAALLVLALFCSTPASAEGEADAMRDLRLKALTTSPAELGFKPGSSAPDVYGVLMDWPIGGGNIATIVAFADGNASLYTTSGFGVIGGVAHAPVREAAIALVKESQGIAAKALPSTDFSYPTPERVRFYFLTFSGAKLAETDRAELETGNGPHWPLFSAAQGVLSRLRAVEKR